MRLPRKPLTANGSSLFLSGRCRDQSEWERGAGLAEKVGKWARHLAAVANEGAAYRGAVEPAANGRRCECAGSLFELAAAADGGWRRVAPAVRGHRGRGVRAARSGAGVSGTCGASGPQRCSGARQAAGRAPWAGRSPGLLGHLPAREARGCGGPSSCPALLPAASLQRAREPSWAVPREGKGKRGMCLLSFPCINQHVLVCGCFVSFRLSTNG